MYQPTTREPNDTTSGPLASAVDLLVAAGWVEVGTVPSPRAEAQRPDVRPVVLVGSGGVLVIGSHKTAEAVVHDVAGVVTALLPSRLRRYVISDNGHDVRSLPELAASLDPRLDRPDIDEAAAALEFLVQAPALLTSAKVLEWTRDARPEPVSGRRRRDGLAQRRQARPVILRAAHAIRSSSLTLGVIISVCFVVTAVFVSSWGGTWVNARPGSWNSPTPSVTGSSNTRGAGGSSDTGGTAEAKTGSSGELTPSTATAGQQGRSPARQSPAFDFWYGAVH